MIFMEKMEHAHSVFIDFYYVDRGKIHLIQQQTSKKLHSNSTLSALFFYKRPIKGSHVTK